MRVTLSLSALLVLFAAIACEDLEESKLPLVETTSKLPETTSKLPETTSKLPETTPETTSKLPLVENSPKLPLVENSPSTPLVENSPSEEETTEKSTLTEEDLQALKEYLSRVLTFFRSIGGQSTHTALRVVIVTIIMIVGLTLFNVLYTFCITRLGFFRRVFFVPILNDLRRTHFSPLDTKL